MHACLKQLQETFIAVFTSFYCNVRTALDEMFTGVCIHGRVGSGSAYFSRLKCSAISACTLYLKTRHLTFDYNWQMSTTILNSFSPTEGDGRLCFRRRQYIDLWTTSWR